MNTYPLTVIKSVWRRIKKPSRTLIERIDAGEFNGRLGCCSILGDDCSDLSCVLKEPDWYTPKPKRHGLARH